MVRINGENVDTDGVTLHEYLVNNGYNLKRIAVEMNGNIVPKAAYSDVVLNSGDSIEIVSFVGGG